ncbi:MAG TPA: M48 family metalloprotease [Burkholderiales bacterium]
MDFFEQQAQARRTSRWFLAWYLVAAAAVVASYVLAAALGYALLATAGALPLAGDEPLYWRGLGATFLEALSRVPPRFHASVALLVGVPMLVVSALRLWRLREGGEAVAELLGASRVEPGRAAGKERRLLNVVEEMAVASGIAVPPVYVLRREQGVNALVAGYSPSEAVLVVTRGALDRLTRDELQGVIAHEFSHILNGDMALNMFLAGLLSGLTWVGAMGERLALSALAARRPDGAPGGDPLSVLFGTLVAFVGFPGSLAADALRARISRERELLADAASVQFTRNPEGIAGALDSLLSLPATTVVWAARGGEFAHMFFAPSRGRWWSFPTHPPIAERIRRAAPRFRRDDYRARRYGRSRDVAVIDGSGNVVKHVRSLGAAAVGRPSAQEVDFAARLLARLPAAVSAALRGPEGAERTVLELARGSLPREHMLTLADLAVPAIKSQPQKARDRFLAELAALVESDGRVTLREFVLFTLLKQRLREGAGQPIRTRYRSLAEIPDDAVAVLSLIALAGRGSPDKAFARGAAIVELGDRSPLAPGSLSTAMLAEALERLRHLAPLAKPALLKACCETAGADGRLTLEEAELVRMIAATLDCPLPPLIAAQDPAELARLGAAA